MNKRGIVLEAGIFKSSVREGLAFPIPGGFQRGRCRRGSLWIPRPGFSAALPLSAGGLISR